MIELYDIDVTYGLIKKKTIIHRLSMKIEPTDRIVLYGPNGVGKTTLVRALCGQLPFSNGEIFWNGQNLTHDLTYRRINSSGNFEAGKMLYHYGTLAENMKLQESLFKSSGIEALEVSNKIILNDLLFNQEIASMSLGQRHRSGIYLAFRKKAKFYFFDEPDNGLDRQGLDDFIDIVQSANYAQSPIIISTHDTILVSKVATKILFMGKNNVKKIVSMEDLPKTIEDLDRILLEWINNN